MRISDWSSDVCSSDLIGQILVTDGPQEPHDRQRPDRCGATVARGGKRTAVNHRVTDFDAGGPSVGENARSEERRGGKECVSTSRTRGSPYKSKKKKNEQIVNHINLSKTFIDTNY